MAILQVRDIDNQLYEELRHRAELDHRTISQEVITIIEEYLSKTNITSNNQTDEFLKLSWSSDETAFEIIQMIYKSRKKGKRFNNGLFD